MNEANDRQKMTISSENSQKIHIVAIGVGSNIDPRINIKKAFQELQKEFGSVKKSTMIETEPVGFMDQPKFVNGAFLISTTFSREELKKKLTEIESKLGRIRTQNKYGPRTIDLDIIVFDGEIVDKDFYTRDFVKYPVLELLPDLKY